MTPEEYKEEYERLCEIRHLVLNIRQATLGLEPLVKHSDDFYGEYREVDSYAIDLELSSFTAREEHLKRTTEKHYIIRWDSGEALDNIGFDPSDYGFEEEEKQD